MMHQFEKKVWPSRSRQTTGNVRIIFPDFHPRQAKTVNRFGRVSVHRINESSKDHQRYYNEFLVVDREKEAQTGRWVLNVIAARDAYHQAKQPNKNDWHTDPKSSSNKKKHSLHSRKSSKVEPIEKLPTQFVSSQLHQNQNMNRFPHGIILTPTSIDDGQTTPMSSISSATSIDDIRTIERSSLSSKTTSRDCSTDEFKYRNARPFISTRMMIIFSIIGLIIVLGVIIGIIVTIFVVQKGEI